MEYLTTYGIIICTSRVDEDNVPFYEMTDREGGYYGTLYCDELSSFSDEEAVRMIEEQIDENLYY